MRQHGASRCDQCLNEVLTLLFCVQHIDTLDCNVWTMYSMTFEYTSYQPLQVFETMANIESSLLWLIVVIITNSMQQPNPKTFDRPLCPLLDMQLISNIIEALTLSQWSSSGSPVAIQCAWNSDPSVHWNATGEMPVCFQWCSSGLPVAFQWSSSVFQLCKLTLDRHWDTTGC